MNRTTKRVATILTTAALALSLTACGPSSGTVLDKDHDPARTRTGTCTTLVNGKAKTYSCLKRDRERWSVELSDGEHTGWRSVGRAAYEACRVGDHYDAKQKTCS